MIDPEPSEGRWEKHMTRFIGASDETAGANEFATFTYGGFVARSEAWVNQFLSPWQTLVLDGPPRVPYFHFKEWRHKPWRDRYGLGEEDAERRIDRAVDIILTMKANLYWVTQSQSGDAHATHIKPLLNRQEFSNRTVRAQLVTPDFDSTMGYMVNALDWANEYWSDCSVVDFYVSTKQGQTEMLIGELRKIRTIFKDHAELAHRSRLFGEIKSFDLSEDNPATNYLPIQAADLLLHLIQKRDAGTIGVRDQARLDRLFQIEGLEHIKCSDTTKDKGKRFSDHADGNDGIM